MNKSIVILVVLINSGSADNSNSVINVDGANYSGCGGEEMMVLALVVAVVVGNKNDGCSSCDSGANNKKGR